MRQIDNNTLAALAGSRPADSLVCWLWYDGRLAYASPLPISSWSLDWDGDERQKVQANLSITVQDTDGTLGPWMLDDPLGVGGSRVQVMYQVGGAGSVDIGWYRITGNRTEESWVFRIIREDGYVHPDGDVPRGYRPLAIPQGSSVSVTAQDLTVELDSDEFLAPENPSTPTVISEVRRLVGDTMPVIFDPAITDESVPRDLVYEENRLDIIMDLLQRVGAVFRMTGDGSLECYLRSTTSRAKLAGGPDGMLINLSRQQSLDQVYNIGVVTSTRNNGVVDVPVLGRYEVTEGPFRTGGPFGRRVIRNGNPLMNSDALAYEAAKSLVLNRLAAQTVDLNIQCLPHPALEVGDYATVEAPQADGRFVPFSGEVLSLSLSGDGTSVNEMDIVLRCRLEDLASALKNFSIADRFTGIREAVTFDSINQNRSWDEIGVAMDDMDGHINA